MKLFDVYPLYDINIVRGSGCTVWDDNGQEYLDLYGGHAVISIGHCHPVYVEALKNQLDRLGFYSNSVVNTLQQQLASRLGKVCGYEDYQLFLINSGAEANENALKLASFHTGRTRILSAQKAFHGRTSLAVEATDNPKIIAPVNANGHVTYLPLNDITAWERELAKNDVAAVILECIQGVGGIRLATPEFAQELQTACRRHGTVLICDEIQCGYGRSGRFFAHQWLGIRPDLITVAKGIANGFPMGAVLISNRLLEKLDSLKATQPHITDVRGRGLMIGIELDIPHKEVRSRLIHDEHCFTGCASTNILRLLPPLCLTEEQADTFIEKLKRSL